MSTDKRPPHWAETILRLLLDVRRQEDVTGDLLEEYRESIVPALGSRADSWYLRQVAWHVARHVMLPAALIALILIVRDLFDTLDPVHYVPGVIHPRSSLMSWALIVTFACAAGRTTWLTSRIRSGVLVAFASAVLGGICSAVGAGVLLAIWHDPATLHAWETSGGLDEALWGVPLLLIPIGGVTGAAGALLTKLLSLPFSTNRYQ